MKRRTVQEANRYSNSHSRSQSASRVGLVLEGEESQLNISKPDLSYKKHKTMGKKQINSIERVFENSKNSNVRDKVRSRESHPLALLQDEPISQPSSTQKRLLQPIKSNSARIEFQFINNRQSLNDFNQNQENIISKPELEVSNPGGISPMIDGPFNKLELSKSNKYELAFSPHFTKEDNLFTQNDMQSIQLLHHQPSFKEQTNILPHSPMLRPNVSVQESKHFVKIIGQGKQRGKVMPIQSPQIPDLSPSYVGTKQMFQESEGDIVKTISQTIFQVDPKRAKNFIMTQNPSIQLHEDDIIKVRSQNQRLFNDEMMSITSQDMLKAQYNKVMNNNYLSPNLCSQRQDQNSTEQIIQEKLEEIDQNLTSINDVSQVMITSTINLETQRNKAPTSIYQANIQQQKLNALNPQLKSSKFSHQYELSFMWQPFNEEGEKLIHNKKKLAMDLYDMGFRDEKVERALRHCKDLRIEALLDYLVPKVQQKYSYQWNHKFVPYFSRFKTKNKSSIQNNLDQSNKYCKICYNNMQGFESEEPSSRNRTPTPNPGNMIQLPSEEREEEKLEGQTQYLDKSAQEEKKRKEVEASTLIYTSSYIIRSNNKLRDLQIDYQIPRYQRGEIQRYFYKVYNSTIHHEFMVKNEEIKEEQKKQHAKRHSTMNINKVSTLFNQQSARNPYHSHRDQTVERKSTVQLTQSIRSNEAIMYGDENALKYCGICLDLYEYHSFDYNFGLLEILDQQFDGILDESLSGQTISQNNKLLRVHLKSKLNNIKEETEAKQNKSQAKLRKLKSQIEITKKKILNQTQSISQNFDCMICFENQSQLKKYKIDIITLECNHKFCSHCLSSYLRARIAQNDLITFKCPSCYQHMKNSMVKDLLTKNEWTYIMDIRDQILQGIIHDVFYCHNCSHPYPKSRISPKGLIKCETCHNIQCFQCNRNHLQFSETCKEALERDYKTSREGMICQLCPRCNKVCEIYPECQQNHIYCQICDIAFCIFCRKQDINPNGDHLNPFSYNVCELIRRPREMIQGHEEHQRDVINKDDHFEVIFSKFNKTGFKCKDKVLVVLIYFLFLPFIGLLLLPIWYATRFYNKKCLTQVPYYKITESQKNDICNNESYKRKILLASIGIAISAILISPFLLIVLLIAPLILFALKS